MKKLFIIPLAMLLLFSCSNSSSNEPTNQENPLIGKWKLIEQKNSDGSSALPTWTPVTIGYELTFKSDGTYTTTANSTCSSGTYSISNQLISYINSCGVSIVDKTRINSVGNTELVVYDLTCFEECQSKFQKIN
jgi:hypothetical protein